MRRKNKVVVQGITGTQGRFHTRLMLAYGTKIIAGCTPGRGGSAVYGIPVYDTMEEVVSKYSPDTSIIFVPAGGAKEAVLEAIDSGIKLVVIITENIPIKDSMEVIARATKAGTIIIGPNCPGIITPGESKVGIMPSNIFKPGVIGVVSRSGTLTYEIAWKITECGLGQTTCVGIGGDPIIGLDFADVLRMFGKDKKTKAIALVGEIGGTAEELAAQYIEKEKYPKPVVAYIVGKASPSGKRMGHAGAIVNGTASTAMSKIEAFTAAGVSVAEKPADIIDLLIDKLGVK